MASIAIGILILLGPMLLVVMASVGLHYFLCWKYITVISRIFTEKPLFLLPTGDPPVDAEDLTIVTSDGKRLRACYLSARAPRRGVIWYGLEFGANRWSCVSYCEHLRGAGYDVFAYEPRNQGDSEIDPTYDPLHWLADRDLIDARAAHAYLKQRLEGSSLGVGIFGISKGAGAAIMAANDDNLVRCAVTDGMFGCYTTVVPYMRFWFRIYDKNYMLQGLYPSWYYGLVARAALKNVSRERRIRFLDLEPALQRFRRPLLMIHGARDKYIRPEMAAALFSYAREPKSFWLIDKAKHNQGLAVAGDEYRARVLTFFDAHLAQNLKAAATTGTRLGASDL